MRDSRQSASENGNDRGRFLLREFLRNEASASILLLVCAVVALIWANSPWHESYAELWDATVRLGTVQFNLEESLQHWVNDGLMAIFFLVLGLEIKREVTVGELASPRLAALPAAAALGGVVVPATLYLLLNGGHRGQDGWGIPMATDIAFALGVLALLGSRIPITLKIFLTALAIVDDLVAVLVIAVVYTSEVRWDALAAAGGFLALLVVANRLGVRQPFVYALLGIGLWAAVFESGVHATIAGVLLAFTIPTQTRFDQRHFLAWSRARLDEFEGAATEDSTIITNGAQQEALAELEMLVEGAGAPSQRLEHALHAWVVFLIVPIFALANAGVRIEGDLGSAIGNRVTLGVLLGLVLGKQLGITLGAWSVVRSGISSLPSGVSWRQLYGASWLAGIGFTMSIFVTDLAFIRNNETGLVTSAKLGILLASLISGVAGYAALRRWSAPSDDVHPSE